MDEYRLYERGLDPTWKENLKKSAQIEKEEENMVD
jgi:hypothetical protein